MRKYRNAASDYEYGAMLGENLNFAASEAYKLLRTNLDFALSDEQKCRIIGMTSSVRGEGKSTTTLNLAYSIAEAGKLVLVIEADMRMPTYTKRLHIQTKKGISNLLAGQCTGADVLSRCELHKNMWVIPAGDIPPNPSELLGSEQMRITLDVLSRDFDYILLDLPPVTAVSDPLVVSKLMNGMLLVVRQNYATRRSVAETVQRWRERKNTIKITTMATVTVRKIRPETEKRNNACSIFIPIFCRRWMTAAAVWRRA